MGQRKNFKANYVAKLSFVCCYNRSSLNFALFIIRFLIRLDICSGRGRVRTLFSLSAAATSWNGVHLWNVYMIKHCRIPDNIARNINMFNYLKKFSSEVFSPFSILRGIAVINHFTKGRPGRIWQRWKHKVVLFEFPFQDTFYFELWKCNFTTAR